MDEVWGDHGGQNCYYYDRCRQCRIHIELGTIGNIYTDRYYVSDILDGIEELIRDRNARYEDYKYLISYLEVFK